MTTDKFVEMTGEKRKIPRHVAIATRHLEVQLSRAVEARDKLDIEIEDLNKALEALGYRE